MKRSPFCSATALSLLFVVAAAPVAHAQQDVIKQAEKLNKTAMEDYDSLEFDSARQTLLTAVSKLRDAGQDETPTAAKIFVNLGIVYISGFKDHNRGVQQLVNALKIDGTITLDPERATPELQEAFEEAQKQVPAAPPEKPPATNGGGNGVHGLQHVAVDEAKAGVDVPIKAQLGSDVAGSKLYLFYRSAGQEDYVSVPMNVNGDGDWVGVIPADAMEGKSVQYYIEVRDGRGRPVVAAGTAASPYIISVTEGKPTDGDRENPLEGLHHRHDADLAESFHRGYGRLFFNVMLGSSLGVEVSGNQTEVAYQFQASSGKYARQAIDGTGTVYQPIHLAFEGGVNITRHFGLSALVRTGFTLLNNADSSQNPPLGYGTSKASADFAAMIRARYLFLDNKIHPLIHFGFGFGSIRHLLDISGAQDGNHPLTDATSAMSYDPNHPMNINPVCPPAPASCVDSVAMGAMFLSAGGGLYIDLVKFYNGGFGIIVDVDAIVALPVNIGGVGQTGLNFDFQIGLGAHFL